jgi:diaminopimelate decarboxylase
MQTKDSAATIGGVTPETLARTYGTPLLVIDTTVLDAALARFAALGAALDLDVCYAGKALLVVALVERLKATTIGLDVCSLGELFTAERAGFPAERMLLHGCGKTGDELAAAAAGRVGRVVIDNREELERLAAIVALADNVRPVDVLLRVNPGIEAHTHAYVRTGGEDSKFGFSRAGIDAAIGAVLDSPRLRLIGIHTHIGSNLFEVEPYEASIAIALKIYARAAQRGAPMRELIAGGGFGVDAHPSGDRLNLEAILRALVARADVEAARLGITRPRIGIEPGRAIVAEAGTSLYRVVTVKHQGSRRFAIVDGSIADNPRPALYGAYHHPVALGRNFAAQNEETTVCGRSCENDELVVAPLPVDLGAGDLLAMGTAGAYTYSMASNYNRFPRPPVVFAGDGNHRAVTRRESLADLIRNDVVEYD